jgi:5-methylcytosine-specific restriction endonuclease McrA
MSLSDYHDLLIELRNENISYKEIAEQLSYKRDTIKHYCQKNDIRGMIDNSLETREQEYIKRFNEKFPNFEYVSGYETYDSKIKVKCKICGHIQERHANNKDYMKCDNCVELDRLERVKAKEIEKDNRVRKENKYTETVCAVCGKSFLRKGNSQKYCSDECVKKANSKRAMHTKICKECGREFETDHDKTLYCSSTCSNRYRRKRNALSKDKRLSLNGKIDYSISLKKLYKRDKGICYICGKQCNLKDIEITEEGYYIAGEDYPSIDHVIPIAKGGKHSWNNIKLAHRCCNAVKGDKLINEIYHKQLEVI